MWRHAVWSAGTIVADELDDSIFRVETSMQHKTTTWRYVIILWKGKQFVYLGTTLNIFEDIKSRMRSGTACCHLVQNRLSFSMLSRNMKIKIDSTNLACCFLWAKLGPSYWGNLGQGCSRIGFLRKTFGPKRDEIIGEWRRVSNEELHDEWSPPNIIR
jgi:hypothetical protein